MDPITQGLLGATVTQAFFSKKLGRKTLPIGISAGMAADLDVLVSLISHDPLFILSLHRHFTHSLFFIPIGALICFLFFMVFPSIRKENKKNIYLASLFAYASHAPLDVMTSYGTLLLWPLNSTRYALDFISIIDPIYTFPLFLGVLFSFVFRSNKPAIFVFTFNFLYLGLGCYQHNQVLKLQKNLAQEREHKVNKAYAYPTLGNLVLWRSVYEAQFNWGSEFYIDSIRAPLFKTHSIKTGGSIIKFSKEDISDALPDEMQSALHTVLWFSNDTLGVENIEFPDKTRFIDFRYSALPWSLEPLWFLKLNHSWIKGSPEPPYFWIQSQDFSKLSEFKDEIFGK